MPGQPLTQQIYIPNDMVGAIIGKGGAKINEIRHLSGSVIKINEPQESSNERLVTITGTAECNQMALYMLYSRLGSYFPRYFYPPRYLDPREPSCVKVLTGGNRKREAPSLSLADLKLAE